MKGQEQIKMEKLFTEKGKEMEYMFFVAEKIGLPAEVLESIKAIVRKITEKGASEEFFSLAYIYASADEITILEAKERLDSLAQRVEASEFSLYMVFVLYCTGYMQEKYKNNNIDECIFWASMDDIRCKVLECMNCNKIVGIKPFTWYDGFFKLNRFALGRFQYEPFPLPVDFITKNGIHISEGTKCFNMHIPSSGIPLTDDVRLDSYRKAYAFYKKRGEFEGENIIFRCASWLLYPKHSEFLPKELNIVRFLNEFDIISEEEVSEFTYAYRIFGDIRGKSVEEYSEKTSMQRAYKKWILDGNKPGVGQGVIVFDGQKIIS